MARTAAIAGLRARYPQYSGHDLETRPLIRIELTESLAWGDLGAAAADGRPAG